MGNIFCTFCDHGLLRKYGQAFDFSEERQKCAKYFKMLAKMYKNWKYLKKGQVIVFDYCTQ